MASRAAKHPLLASPHRVNIALSLLAGLLVASSFPPVDSHSLIWIGLVPLLWVIDRSANPRAAFMFGALAAALCALMVLHPLVSASSWAGWANESHELFAARMGRQWWCLHGLWLIGALWGAFFWGSWAFCVRLLAPRGGWRLLFVAPSAWIVIPEWLRVQTTFGFTWALLGNATASCSAIRQLAALGGVWLLSGLVVVVNVGIAALVTRTHSSRRWPVPVVACSLLIAAWSYGAWVVHRPAPTSASFLAVAVQSQKTRYTMDDFESSGFDRQYRGLIKDALHQAPRLIVLPESIALGVISLDGTVSSTKPAQWQHARSLWEREIATLLRGSRTILIAGLDTVEGGADHNTLIAWTAEGIAGWYHKRQLVPFAESLPFPWSRGMLRGRAIYAPGAGSQLLHLEDLVLGGFICQEVLFPWVTRESVRDGATILISGGNDGVFENPAVARVHAAVAQLRAVETGRYLVRAMKTGISAIIDPHGREVVRSHSSEPAMLQAQIIPQQTRTLYVQWGDWVVWWAWVLTLAGGILRSRHAM